MTNVRTQVCTGRNNLARVHDPPGIEELLDLFECADETSPVKTFQPLGAHHTVAMFARRRAAVADDQVGNLARNLVELLDFIKVLQIDHGPQMQATAACVRVHG